MTLQATRPRQAMAIATSVPLPRLSHLAVALAVIGIVAAYAWSARFWVDVVDEGYFLDLGQRVLDGALPYRDFTTYYTPGIFYLFALAFKLFGTNLLVIRYLMAGLRGLCALLLYGLARRVAPWPLAWLPFAIVAALDQWPIEPEPHPSWPAIVACLLTLELLVRHMTTHQRRWLALAGATAGLTYLFKQNVGAFTALGVAGYVLLRQRAATDIALRLVQIAFAVATSLLVTKLMWSYLDERSAGALWLPLLATLGVLMYRAFRAPVAAARRADQPSQPRGAAEGSVVLDAAVATAAFAAVTLSWLVPLIVAIGPDQTPLGLFVGELNTASITTRYAPFTSGIPPLLLAAIWIPTVLLVSQRVQRRGLIAVALLLSAIVVAMPVWQGPRDPLTGDPQLQPLASGLDERFGTLTLYLPSLAAWAGIVGLLTPKDGAGPLAWYVLFGTLVELEMYPRADVLHAIVAAPPALVAGAGALSLLSCRLRRLAPWCRAGVMAALLAVPFASVLPQVMERLGAFDWAVDQPERLDYVELGLPRAPVLVPRQMAEDMRGAVSYVDYETPPGAPFFVYPVAPLFNFLADRPNPTHFDHLLPGTLTSADFAEVIAELQQARPEYVLWDHMGVLVWETDAANRPLSDYIWKCYSQVATFSSYLVLERRPDACR